MPKPPGQSHSPEWESERPLDPGDERILAAARELLDLSNLASFSLDAVAKRAGVTRMTVYNRFGSKAGLLEKVFDLLIERGAFREAPLVFTEPDLDVAIDRFVGIMGRFYTENRPALSSLSTAGGSDPDLDKAMQSRNSRRRHALQTLFLRLGKEHRPAVPQDELVNTADVLLSFNTFNALAGPSRTPNDVVPLVRQLLRGLLGFSTTVSGKKSGSARKRPRKRS